MTAPPRFGELFSAHVRNTPDAPALVWHDDEVSYSRLAGLARARCSLLGEVAPDEPIGILAPKSPDTVALVLACLLTGRRFLLPSPALTPDTLAELFAQAGCRTVLRETDVAASTVPAAGPLPAPPAPDGIGFMLTTSGSTGMPKVVPLPHRALDAFAAWAAPAFGIGPGRTVLNYAPLNFDLCLLDIWTTLAHGGRVVLVDTALAARGRHLLDLLRRHRPHVVQAVPMFFGLVLDAAAAAGDPGPVDGVAHVLVTGDVLGEETLAGMPSLFPYAQLSNVYGCTETNDSLVARMALADARHPVPLGEPLPGVHTVVVGPSGTAVDGPGTGELYVRTPFQSPGYLDAARTIGRFVPHPLGADGHTWFRTGDLVRRDRAGLLYLVGRADFQVKVRGVAVNTAEVESVLLRHPDVLEAAVAVRTDPVVGKQLAAVVHRRPGSGLNTFALRRHCSRQLPQAAVPAHMRIVDAPLPRTPTGKLDRAAADRMPDLTTTGRTS